MEKKGLRKDKEAKDEKFIDDKAREVAFNILEQDKDMKIPLQKVQFYASYMQGMREAYIKLFPRIIASAKKADKPYLQAEYELLTSCIDACYDYHLGKYVVHYKDHVRDKKGNLVRCTAYFVRKASVDIEVKYTKR